MSRISLTLAALLAFAASAQARADRPPNVVLILADDLGWGDVGFNGRKEWATPNLDRLAAQGTTFARWYTAAVVCAPSRAALMTGKYTIHDGVSRNNDDLPASEVTIAEALKARGYATALFGKWHHGTPRAPSKDSVHPMDQGFDEFFGFTDAKHAWEQFPKELWHGRELKPVSGYANDLFTDRAVDFLERHKDAPVLPLPALHRNPLPHRGPRGRGRAAPRQVPRGRPGEPAQRDLRRDGHPARPQRRPGPGDARRLGLADDTIVIFTSDHGATFEQGNKGTSNFHDSNRPFRGQKRTLWEGGIRVPGVVRWPGHVPAGVVSREDRSQHRHPADPPGRRGWLARPGLEGRRRGPAPRLDRAPRSLPIGPSSGSGGPRAATSSRRCGATSSSSSPAERRPELFDVEADPAERRSLAAQYPDEAKALEAALKAWLATERENPRESPGPSRPAAKARIAR